jgi:tetratricopeptide (TPR) repeat protein
MHYKHALVSLAVLALVVGDAAAAPPATNTSAPATPVAAAPAGQNAISQVRAKVGGDGEWKISIEYFYTGSPGAVVINLLQRTQPYTPGTVWKSSEVLSSPKPGRHTFTVEMPLPEGAYTLMTDQLQVEMKDSQTGKTWLSQVVPVKIDWPDPATLETDRALAKTSPEAVVQTAAAYIDRDDDMIVDVAKPMLERVIQKYPRTHTAYIEIARVVMKTNWSPEGLRQAASLIGSALEIRPDSKDAKILLGYVYSYQQRYKESEALFADAAKARPDNLWLWVNWGELFQLQDRAADALGKYRIALERGPTGDKNDNARRQAYAKSLEILKGQHRLDEEEALLRQRVADYGSGSCRGIEYAYFLLIERGDPAGSTRLLQRPSQEECKGRSVRLLLGLSQYLGWATSGQADFLRQARVSFPIGPHLFYHLADTERMLLVARKLLATGERVDVQDEQQMDALGYALAGGNTAAARRLLALGAPVTSVEGADKTPVALIPVLVKNVEGIRLMQKAGVDYRALRFRGSSAMDHARATGDEAVMRALEAKTGRL